MSSSSQNTGSQGLVANRSPWKARLNAWRKHSPLNPYWLETVRLHRAVEFLAPHARGDLLDVGVGERPYAALFEPHVTSYWGLEYPPVTNSLYPELWDMLERLRGIVDVFGDGQCLPFADNSFDTVMALEVFEHLRAPETCMAEIDRVLRPGGAVLFTVPFVSPLHQLPFDFHRFTPQGIEVLLAHHGFEVERIQARGNFSTTTGSVVAHWILRTFGSTALLHDGSVRVSRIRGLLVAPLIALVQLTAMLFERFTSDKTLTLGYSVVARRR